MDHFSGQGLGGLVLLQRGMVELVGLAVQLLSHLGQPGRGGPEAQNRLVHGLDNGPQALLDQGKVALVLHLGGHVQIAAGDLSQHLLDI